MLAIPYQALDTIGKILFISKYVGTVGVAVGVLYGGARWLAKLFKKVATISLNIQTALDNHLPHLQSSLDSHGEALVGIRSEIRNMTTRFDAHSEKLNETADSLGQLRLAFMNHLDTTKEKNPPHRKNKG